MIPVMFLVESFHLTRRIAFLITLGASLVLFWNQLREQPRLRLFTKAALACGLLITFFVFIGFLLVTFYVTVGGAKTSDRPVVALLCFICLVITLTAGHYGWEFVKRKIG